MQLKIAQTEHIDAILNLHTKYHKAYMDNYDKANGFVTTPISRESLHYLIEVEQGVFIVEYGEKLLAYLMTGSWEFWLSYPLFQTMAKDLSGFTYQRKKVNKKVSCVCGPYAIEEEFRGSGILQALFNIARMELQKKYTSIITFVDKTNLAAFNAYHHKLGMEILREFTYEESKYYQMIYDTTRSVTLLSADERDVYTRKPFIFFVDYPIEYLDYDSFFDKETMEYIYADLNRNYYWSDDFSPEYYIAQAKAGFIAVTMEEQDLLLLTPEIQKNYALLDFEDLHISKKVQKLIKQRELQLEISKQLDEVYTQINAYHEISWLKPEYLQTLKSINLLESDTCQIVSVGIRDEERLIAGELGIIIGRTYTSLTGFSSREKYYRNYGTAQLVLLAQYLEENGFAFLNLGQPYMPYKLNLGAKVYDRDIFLARWLKAIQEKLSQ